MPRQHAAVSAPLSASQIRKVSSQLPETMRRPSGLNATLPHRALMPRQPLQFRPGLRVPDPQGVVPTARDDAPTIGAERDALHRTPSSVAPASQPQGAVPTARHDAPTIGAQRDALTSTCPVSRAGLSASDPRVGPNCPKRCADHRG